MFMKLKLAALAVVASASMSSAAVLVPFALTPLPLATTDAISSSGDFDTGTGLAPVGGDTLLFDTNNVVTTLGDFFGVDTVDDFSLVLATGSANDGTVINFSSPTDTFAFEITDTTVYSGAGTLLVLGGLGTVTGSSLAAPLEASFNITSSAGFLPDGAFDLSIVSPPDPTFVPAVPLPAGMPLLIAGLGAFAFARKMRKA
jgi:hypothetical protein